jgi:hypothetical protein
MNQTGKQNPEHPRGHIFQKFNKTSENGHARVVQRDDMIRNAISIVIAGILFCCLAGCAGRGEQAGASPGRIPRMCDYPTKAGTYEKDGWKYIFEGDTFSDSQSAKCHGRLFRSGEELQGQVREVIDTPLGKFMFCAGAYNRGWLNTCTYEVRLFDEKGNIIQR